MKKYFVMVYILNYYLHLLNFRNIHTFEKYSLLIVKYSYSFITLYIKKLIY